MQKGGIGQKITNAYMRAMRDYNTAPKDGRLAGRGSDEIITILTESTNIKDPKTYRAMIPFAANPDGHVNVASLKNDYVFFRDRGLVSGKVTVEQVIDHSFADEAGGVRGRHPARQETAP